MQFLSAIVALISLCTHASTKTIEVAVGQHSLQYMPSTIVADIGDNIQFNFYGVHSVVQSAFESPCKPLPLGLFGGDISSCLVFDAAPPSAFVHSVIDTNPIWFHCASEGHCQGGLVGVINPPLNQTLAHFITAAKATDPNAGPDVLDPHYAPPIGGLFVNINSSSSTSVATHTSLAESRETSSMGRGSGGAVFQGGALTFVAVSTSEVSFASTVAASLGTTTSIFSSSDLSTTFAPPSTTPLNTSTPPTSITSIPTHVSESKASRKKGSGLQIKVMTDQARWDEMYNGIAAFLVVIGGLLVLLWCSGTCAI